MMRARATMAAILLLTAGTAPAARLCRDSKGLFTPCTGERPLPEHRRPRAAAAAVSPGAVLRSGENGTMRERAPSRPPLVAKAKLCRDSKGLFTPCAH